MKGIKLKKNIILVTLILIFSSCVISCGLDTFYVLDPPTSGNSFPNINTEPLHKVFSFRTNERQSSSLPSDFKFLGTEVYYMIYTDENVMQSVYNSIESKNTSSSYDAAFRELESKGYVALQMVNKTDDTPLISKAGIDRTIEIRLTDYNSISDPNPSEIFSPYIKIDNVKIGIPCRIDRKNFFDFGRSEQTTDNPLPDIGDSDFYKQNGTFSKTNTYYVDMYAVTKGMDLQYIKYNSRLLYLGAISINANEYQN